MMKLKISKTWLIIIIIVLLVAGYFGFKMLFKSSTDGYITEKAGKGTVLQEVSETGSAKATENISMGFKTIGRISKINVAVGDNVKKGDILAELDSSQTLAQLQNYKNALDSAVAKYDKLINGLTPADIKTYEDVVIGAKRDLKDVYDSALNSLDDSYTKIYNASATALSAQNDYFSGSDQQGMKVQDSKKDIDKNMLNAKKYLDSAETSLAQDDIDLAVSQMIIALENVYNDLNIIRNQCDEGVYYSKISLDTKTALNTQKGYINTASTSTIDAKQAITSDKISLQKAEDNLAFKTDKARPEDINIYQAEMKQAEANVNLYQSQLSDNFLRSPIDAKITEVNAKYGEVVTANESVINLLSTEPFQIKVDIYEQDVVNVKVGNTAKINLVAFPKQTFEGKVLSIYPGEKIIDNIVYYEVTIDFPDQPQGIMSGMTADITIETNRKDDILRLPKNAIENLDGKSIVQIINKNNIENREVTVGLEGNDYVEITSDLSEGEEIIVGKK